MHFYQTSVYSVYSLCLNIYRIDESLCRVDDESLLEESLTAGDGGVVDGTRCETRATVEGEINVITVLLSQNQYFSLY